MTMRMELAATAGGPLVTGFGPGGFRIGDRQVRATLLTTAAAFDWSPPGLADLTPDDLAVVIETAPEFLLLGTGPVLARPPSALVERLDALGIGLEPMDSRAAARAWSVLRAEGRAIGAALLPLA